MSIATVVLTIAIGWLLVRAVAYVRRRGMCAICEVRGCPLVNLKPPRRRSLMARLFKPERQPPCGAPPSRRPAIRPADAVARTDLDLTATTDFDIRTLLSTQERSQQ
jgi:hypothetical protein